jgi:HK97 family phage portal protein
VNALSTLNATPIGAAARGVGRFAAATSGFTMRFQTRLSYGWQMLLSRTRIDYRAEIGDPATNSIVGAVVGWIARNLPDAQVRIVVEGTTDTAYLPAATGPGFMLRLLERPNPYYSGPLQWSATLVDWICNGNAYWLKERSGSGRVIGLWWVPQRFMEPVWPGSGRQTSPGSDAPPSFISHYEYTVDGVIYTVAENDVVHFRNGIDPNNTRKGLSRLASLFREIFTDDEAANFTASLLKNLGVPGVILAPSNTGMATGKADPEAIKTTFMEKFGGDKRGEPMVMSSPTDIKVLSWSPEQMNLKDLRRIPEERISAVLGVPAGVAQLGAGLDRSTFNNIAEGNVSAYTQGIIPSQRLLAADLEIQLLPEFANTDRESLDVWFDWTKAAAMQAAADAIWKRHEGAATKGLITRAEFKRAVGKPVTDEDNVYILPNNYATIGAGGNTPPGSGQRRAVAQIAEIERPLLEAREPLQLTTSAIRCESCNSLLAEQATAPYRFTCRKCHTVNESPAVAA